MTTEKRKPNPSKKKGLAASNERRMKRQSRESEQRPASDAWNPASTLPIPEPREGYVFRWIRTSMLDKADVKNVSRKMREGWQPVTAEDHPELKAMSDLDSRFPDNVEIGGLLLCKAPAEMVEKRRDYYAQLAEGQMEAVDNSYYNEDDRRMKKFDDRKSRTSFGPR